MILFCLMCLDCSVAVKLVVSVIRLSSLVPFFLSLAFFSFCSTCDSTWSIVGYGRGCGIDTVIIISTLK